MRETGSSSLSELWARLAARPYVARGLEDVAAFIDRVCPGDRDAIRQAAERIRRREIDILGSGPTTLGHPVDWSVDFKTGVRWREGYARRIPYLTPARHGDVKVPWELSRLQWLIPLAQSYVLTHEESDAAAARTVLEEWIAANPYAMTINWAIAMEPAIRILTWTFLFHAFKHSKAWADPEFRRAFLISLYLHVDYVERNLEISDVSGNHLDADAAGLVFGGLFFGEGRSPKRWAEVGWRVLVDELPRQVGEDGVDFEASTAYHRLVGELFLLPALYRERLGITTRASYTDRLTKLARFVVAYTRPDGLAPLWGDGDDGRALPLGSQPLRDHRYLIGLVGLAWNVADLREEFSGPRGEVLWLLGGEKAMELRDGRSLATSSSFPTGGVYVMRTGIDHVFVDSGPVGMAGRGGHGHNDCLSLDLVLASRALLADPGTFVYTADYEWRNRFRGTSFHNTPRVDDAEQNRFVDPNYLWSLMNDAVPRVLRWSVNEDLDILQAAHSGYERLAHPTRIVRTVALDRRSHRVLIEDQIESDAVHRLRVPFHLDPSVTPFVARDDVRLSAGDTQFRLLWTGDGNWRLTTEPSWYSESYGVRTPTTCLEFECDAAAARLCVVIAPSSQPDDEIGRWRSQVLAELRSA